MTKFAGRTVFVSGAGSGIGYQTALHFAKAGARIVADGGTAVAQRADAGDEGAVEGFVQRCIETFGGVDGVYANAGVSGGGKGLFELTVDDWQHVLRVNLIGLKRLTYGLIPKLSDGASIVNVASLAGFKWPEAVDAIKDAEHLDFHNLDQFIDRWKVSSEGGRSYFFSKEALIVWTMQNRWTWRDRGIRMNAVSPGPVDTPILGDFLETLGARAEEDRKIMDRPGTPEDIAPVIAFLLSDMTSWIRGTNIPTDGGMSSNILCGMHGL